MKIADFAETGNIEISQGARRILVGQLSAGQFIIHERFRDDKVAQARIDLCLLIAESYGITPEVVYRSY